MEISLPRIKLGLTNPNLLLRVVNQNLHTRFGTREYNYTGVDVFAEDWDNLLILDACRYDLFMDIAAPEFPGTTEARISRGSATPEFLLGNFRNRDLRDTIYVTSNPQMHRRNNEINPDIYETIEVWLDEGWNDTWGTVLPETVTEYAIQSFKKYPNKRLVVHYMQPHIPFITDDTVDDKGYLEREDEAGLHLWMKLMTGQSNLSREQVWSAYRKNLQRTLPHIKQLIESIDGRTVITSDHGNMLGERSWPIPIRQWGHPPGVHTSELLKVPWHTIKSTDEDRREIISEDHTHRGESTIDEQTVTNRLQQLGYIE